MMKLLFLVCVLFHLSHKCCSQEFVCEEIQLKGASQHRQFNGYYLRTTYSCGDKPTYRRVVGQSAYVLYYNKLTKRWGFEMDYDIRRCPTFSAFTKIIGPGEALIPSGVTNIWMEVIGDQRWEENESLLVDCTDTYQVRACSDEQFPTYDLCPQGTAITIIVAYHTVSSLDEIADASRADCASPFPDCTVDLDSLYSRQLDYYCEGRQACRPFRVESIPHRYCEPDLNCMKPTGYTDGLIIEYSCMKQEACLEIELIKVEYYPDMPRIYTINGLTCNKRPVYQNDTYRIFHLGGAWRIKNFNNNRFVCGSDGYGQVYASSDVLLPQHVKVWREYKSYSDGYVDTAAAMLCHVGPSGKYMANETRPPYWPTPRPDDCDDGYYGYDDYWYGDSSSGENIRISHLFSIISLVITMLVNHG